MSEGGLLVAVNEALSMGQDVKVSIARPEGEPIALRAHVVRYSKEQHRPRYGYGLELVEPTGRWIELVGELSP